jgi:WD40 repeat protein
VLVWSVADGQSVFQAFAGGGVAFSPDGKYLASGTDVEAVDSAGDRDNTPTVHVWNVETWKATPFRHDRPVRQVAFGPGGVLAYADTANTVKVVYVGSDKKAARELATIRPAGLADLAFSPDRTRLATADRFARQVTVWDTTTGNELYSIPGHGRVATAVAFSPDGGTLAAAGGLRWDTDLSVRLWPGRDDPEVTTFQGHREGVWAAAFLPDGERVVSVGGTGFNRPGQALLWDARTGQEIRSLSGHTSIVFGVAAHPDGKVVATGGADKTVRLWDVETGRGLKVLEGHQGQVMGVAFSPDGTRLVSVGEGRKVEGKVGPIEVRVWEVPGGRPITALDGVPGQARWVAWRPDGDEFAVAATEINVAARQMTAVVTLHAPDGPVRRTLRLDPMTRAGDLDYRPGGRRLTVVVVPFAETAQEAASVVREYDPATDTWRDLIPARPHGPMSLAFTPDGRRLATGNEDGTVKVWDAEAARELLTLTGLSLGPSFVTVSPNGGRLAAVGGDARTVRVWDATAR